MSGFLLAEDAVSARKQQFDNWMDEQRRNAEQAAQQAQQAAQAAVQQQTSEAAARAQQFQDWVSQQQQPSAPAAPAAPPQPAAAAAMPELTTQTPPPATGPDPDVQARARQFQDWITQQQQQQPSPATQPVSPFAETPPTTQAAALPHAEEPATASDALGGKWKTNFDFGATYTGNYRTGTPHRGVDLVPNQGGIGTSVEAFTPGTVTNISRDSGAGGLMVYVQDAQGRTHAYMHLADAAPGLQVGQRVNRGDPIATMGESGTEGAPHLHYEVRQNAATGDPLDKLIDPRPYVAGAGGEQRAAAVPPSRFFPTGQTTAGMSGGGARSGQVGDQGTQILSGAADVASWLGNDGQKALQSILVTEGGLAGARGDSGRSAGPLQFFEGGQLANFAKAFQMSLEEAKTYVEQHPLEAIRWAIGVPSNPGYLGAALVQGLQRNLSGPDLATYAQRTGQVSDSPERAGDNYRSLFGQGQEVIRGAATGAVEGALEAGRQVATRAGDLVTQGQQLVEQGAQGARDAWSQFDQMQAQTRANTDRWLAEQRERMETQATERQQQGLEFQRTLDEQRRQFQQNAEPINRPPLEGFTAPGGPVGQAFEQLGSAINPSFGTQADVERRVQERLAEQGQAEPQTPGFGDVARAVGLVGGGPASLRGQTPREVRQRLDEDVARFVREQVPGGDNPVAGPLITMVGQELTHPENYLLAGPLMQLGRGTAATLGLSGTRGAIADWAVQGGVFSAVAEASKPGATPESVGEAFVTGAGFAGALPGLGALAPIGRKFLNSPQLNDFLRTRQRAEAEIGFALGRPTGGAAPEPPTTRMFHGTGGAFDRPEAAKFDPNGLFGPGYYLTSDPRVAGGVVARGGEEMVAARVLNRPDLPRREPGQVISPGYAQQRGLQPLGVDDVQRMLQEIAATPGIDPAVASYIGSDAARQANGSMFRGLTRDEADGRLRQLLGAMGVPAERHEGIIARALPIETGPNVRPVDVPQDLRLLDVEQGTPVAEAQNLLARVAQKFDEIGDSPVADKIQAYGAKGIFQDVRPFDNTVDTARLIQNLYATAQRIPGHPDMPGNAHTVAQALSEAGFDGIKYSGGKRIPLTDAAGLPIEHQATVIFPESMDKLRNAVSGRQGGQIEAQLAARLGGGAAGVASQEMTMSEEDKSNPLLRVSRDLSGALLGAAAPGLAVSGARGIAATARGRAPNLADLTQIRQTLGVRQVNIPGTAGQRMTPAELISALGKQNLLAGIKQHVTNITSQMVELARTPARAALAGEGDQALISLRAGVHGIPDAMREFARTWSSGISATATPGQRTQAWLPVFRFLGATDDFFRTVGAHMGMATEAQRLVNEAGANTPQAVRQVLQQNEQQIFNAGRREGASSVFQAMGAQGAQDAQSSFGSWKNGLLASVAQSPAWQDQLKAYGKQGLGLVVDAIVPFAGMPARIWDIGLGRLPVVGEVRRFTELAMALQRRDSPAAQRALGELGMQSLTTSAILSNVMAGNVRGPDDKDHPNSVLMGNTWVDYSGWGAFQLPLAVPAATVEAWRKVGNKVDAQELDYVTAVLGAWGKALSNSYYLNSVFDTITAIGQGGLPGAMSKTLTSYTDRGLPSGLNQVEQMIDANVREVSKEFPKSVVDRVASRIPYLATTLNTQVEQTTGGARQREKQGPLGVLFGAETYDQPPIEREIMRLNRLGYALTPPRANPTTISVGGSQIKLGEAEQRALGQARGQRLQEIVGARMNAGTWDSLTDDQKARIIARALSRASEQNVAVWKRMTPAVDRQTRIARGERVVGRLVDQGEFGGFTAPSTAA